MALKLSATDLDAALKARLLHPRSDADQQSAILNKTFKVKAKSILKNPSNSSKIVKDSVNKVDF